MGLLRKKTIDIVVSDLGEKRVVIASEGSRFVDDVLNCSGDLKTGSLAADLDETDCRPLVKYDNKQAAADHSYVDAFALTLVDDSGKFVLADELGHAGRRRNITGSQRRKTGRVHITDIAVKSDRLAVSVNQEYDASGTFYTQPRENSLYSLKLSFLYYKGRFSHFGFGVRKE